MHFGVVQQQKTSLEIPPLSVHHQPIRATCPIWTFSSPKPCGVCPVIVEVLGHRGEAQVDEVLFVAGLLSIV